jgi:DNA repair ATPase RecN
VKRPTDCPKQRGRKIPCTLTQCRYYERHAKLSCALWEAENGEHKLEEIGDILGLSRQRIEQIQRQALAKLLTIAKRHGMTVDQLPALADAYGTPSRWRTR